MASTAEARGISEGAQGVKEVERQLRVNLGLKSLELKGRRTSEMSS